MKRKKTLSKKSTLRDNRGKKSGFNKKSIKFRSQANVLTKIKKIHPKSIDGTSSNLSESQKNPITTKLVQFSIGLVISEALFWIGLLIVVSSFFLNLEIFIMVIGLFLMILSLIQFIISHKRNKSVRFGKMEPLSTQKIVSEQGEKDYKEGKKIAKANVKEITRKINKGSFILILTSTIIFLLYKFNMLFSIVGLSLVFGYIFILIVILSKKRGKKTESEGEIHKSLAVSPELRNILNNLKGMETEIDILLDYIKEKKSISLTLAAKYFGLKKEKVEEWARILEDNNMIKIFYPPIGDPLLKSID